MLLDKVVHQSKPSTCQALLILGHREFGIGKSISASNLTINNVPYCSGSMEQGWIYFGMNPSLSLKFSPFIILYTGVAIRMAIDLGLNRNADKWQYRGADLFSPEDKQMRKQVWYGCIMADEYSSVYMGKCLRMVLLFMLIPD